MLTTTSLDASFVEDSSPDPIINVLKTLTIQNRLLHYDED